MFAAMDFSKHGHFGEVMSFALFFLPPLYVKYAYQFYETRTKSMLLAVTIIATVFFVVSIVGQYKPKAHLSQAAGETATVAIVRTRLI
jgi:hypothetical protein